MKDKPTRSTWKDDPKTDKWNSNDNWEPHEVPTDTATFSRSQKTFITFEADQEAKVDAVEFAPDAPPYTFMFGTDDSSPALTIAGEGVRNDSNHMQSFVVASVGVSYKDPKLRFANKANAGGTNMHYYAGPETLENGYGGGIIGFSDDATAGSAIFVVTTGAVPPPRQGSTVGGEVAFCDRSTAGTARFTIYGTLGTDGDTFANVVFHDNASADRGTFINIGGTVSGGDGGNTQFYVNSNAAHGVYQNYGGSFAKANGGDVAFDGNATAGHGRFHNHQATADGAYGGVTSFNNNPPDMEDIGCSAGNAVFYNYGANESGQGGGGHTEFTAKHGSATAENGTFMNFGSVLSNKSSAGHTIFELTLPTKYYPTAGQGIFWNYPALAAGGAGGYTEFAIWGDGDPGSRVPTAAEGTFMNLGGCLPGATGGYTSFGGASTAANAKLIATGGTNGGYGGKIAFYDQSSGGAANVQLIGNGELDLGNHTGELTIGVLQLSGGIISTQLGTQVTSLRLSEGLILNASKTTFSFWKKDNGGFQVDTSYTVLTAPNLSEFRPDQFTGNSIDGAEPVFEIVGNDLRVTFKSK